MQNNISYGNFKTDYPQIWMHQHCSILVHLLILSSTPCKVIVIRYLLNELEDKYFSVHQTVSRDIYWTFEDNKYYIITPTKHYSYPQIWKTIHTYGYIITSLTLLIKYHNWAQLPIFYHYYYNPTPTDILCELHDLLLFNGLSQFQRGIRKYNAMIGLEYSTYNDKYKVKTRHYKYMYSILSWCHEWQWMFSKNV